MSAELHLSSFRVVSAKGEESCSSGGNGLCTDPEGVGKINQSQAALHFSFIEACARVWGMRLERSAEGCATPVSRQGGSHDGGLGSHHLAVQGEQLCLCTLVSLNNEQDTFVNRILNVHITGCVGPGCASTPLTGRSCRQSGSSAQCWNWSLVSPAPPPTKAFELNSLWSHNQSSQVI